MWELGKLSRTAPRRGGLSHPCVGTHRDLFCRVEILACMTTRTNHEGSSALAPKVLRKKAPIAKRAVRENALQNVPR